MGIVFLYPQKRKRIQTIMADTMTDIPVDTYPTNFQQSLISPVQFCRMSFGSKRELIKTCQSFHRKTNLEEGYEHLCDPLHILVEAELPSNTVDTRLRQAQEIIDWEISVHLLSDFDDGFPFSFLRLDFIVISYSNFIVISLFRFHYSDFIVI
ncbi:hypothetical protein ZOSMA_246G00090 [Zostera marina]|uniref:Uncharacterized protein n=1 Tax=Zostera marina TaxID=29655 RepID=A0A0K9PGN1_ZOSMR|nr:hypothetical protein ZOSMA_246G00090 [Zostera marina]